MDGLGRAEVLDDLRFVDCSRGRKRAGAARHHRGGACEESAREWETILEAAGAPCASIWKIEEVIDHPQIAARGALQEIDTPLWRLRFAGKRFPARHGGRQLDSDGARTQRPYRQVSPRSLGREGHRRLARHARSSERALSAMSRRWERHRERHHHKGNRIAFLPVAATIGCAPICAVSNSSHGNAAFPAFLRKRCAMCGRSGSMLSTRSNPC